MLGDARGDRLLVDVACRLKSAVRARPSSSVARLFGDVFAVVLPKVASEAAALEEACAICAVFDAPFDLHGRSIRVGVRAGVAFGPAHHLSRPRSWLAWPSPSRSSRTLRKIEPRDLVDAPGGPQLRQCRAFEIINLVNGGKVRGL
jgi:hypothetical protein